MEAEMVKKDVEPTIVKKKKARGGLVPVMKAFADLKARVEGMEYKTDHMLTQEHAEKMLLEYNSMIIPAILKHLQDRDTLDDRRLNDRFGTLAAQVLKNLTLLNEGFKASLKTAKQHEDILVALSAELKKHP